MRLFMSKLETKLEAKLTAEIEGRLAARLGIITLPDTLQVLGQEISIIKTQLQAVQDQQRAIMTDIEQVRADQHQLYQQALAIQSSNEQHDSFINSMRDFSGGGFLHAQRPNN